MTPEEAMKILKAQGFEFEDPDVDKWPAIFLAGEQVGTLYDDEVYLAEYIPSLFDRDYKSTSKKCIKFHKSEEDVKLYVAIDRIKCSLGKYDSEKRKQRVNLVKQYFQQRDTAKGTG